MTTLLTLASVTVAVGASVLALLWARDRLIDRWCEGFHYGLGDVTPADLEHRTAPRRINGGAS